MQFNDIKSLTSETKSAQEASSARCGIGLLCASSIALAATCSTPAIAQEALSPSEQRQHEQAQAALQEEPKLWEDIVGMEFLGGAYPNEEQAARIFDEYDFQRATQGFIWSLPAMNMYSMREGSEKLFGKGNHILPVWKERLRATTQVTTPNSDVIYAMSYLDTKDGPVVVESPPNIQGLFDDMFQRPIADVGFPGADRGRGGKYLILPPDYDGPIEVGVHTLKAPDDDPHLYYVFQSPTYGVFLFWRAFLDEDGQGTSSGVGFIEQTKVYSWGKKAEAPPMEFPDATFANAQMLIPNITVGDDPYRYFENLADYVNYEYVQEEDKAFLGMLQGIGIEKGKPFNPSDRMKNILRKASIAGYNMSRANRYASRDPAKIIWEGKRWEQPWIRQHVNHMAPNFLDLNSRAAFFHIAYSSSPAMVDELIDVGAKYPMTMRDGDGNYFNGSNSYKLEIPADMPAKIFWSVSVYNAFSASGVDNGQPFPSINSMDPITYNEDGSATFYFGPELPEGAPETNYLRTLPGEGWFTLFRLYGPERAYFDGSWQLPDIEKLN